MNEADLKSFLDAMQHGRAAHVLNKNSMGETPMLLSQRKKLLDLGGTDEIEFGETTGAVGAVKNFDGVVADL